ncbi:MAG: hypothetical protein HC834_03285 [Rhodospirillales bacterium]|nr:hypothetical protein [Rhodospirillales bacterium]
MSITNENTENIFSGNGLTTVFPTTISAFFTDQVLVYIRENSLDTLQTLSTHYTLSGFKPIGSNDDADGTITVTMLSAPTVDQEVVVVRATDKTQDLALTSTRAYNPEVLMQQLDLVVMMIQEIAKSQARTFKVKPGITVPTEIDNPDALADALDIIANVLSGTGWQLADLKLVCFPLNLPTIRGNPIVSPTSLTSTR